MRPLIGRSFASGEDKPTAAYLAVLSESIWRRRFAASSAVLGQTIRVNGTPATVIGVMPGVFRFPLRADRSLGQPDVESAFAVRTVVLSWSGALETRRYARRRRKRSSTTSGCA